jgi:phospholipase/carboxylesterase
MVASVPQSRVILKLGDNAVASVPATASGSAIPPRLIVLLHGAGQTPDEMIARFARDADCADAVLLAPKSRGPTWDVILAAQMHALDGQSLTSDVYRYSTSSDADRVTEAIASLGKSVKTDSAQRFLLGFSDGATFALALGTSRDMPYAGVVALSPGLAVVASRPARKRAVLIMHGTNDRSLPFDFTRSTIVPMLRAERLAVRFMPFRGGHEIAPNPCAVLAQQFPVH